MTGRVGTRRGRGAPFRVVRLLVLATVVVGMVWLGPPAAAAPRLLLTPSAAEAGQPVQAVLSGFEDCTRQTPKDVAGQPGTVRLTWDDGRDAARPAQLAGGQATVSLTVPDDLAPGPHTMVADCVEIPVKLQAESPTFTVLPPAPTSTTPSPTPTSTTPSPTPTPTVETPTSQSPTDVLVPDLQGRTAAEAEAALVDVGLRLGRVDDTAVEDGVGVVDRQDPNAGERLAPGGTVDITLAAVVALVTVPDVVGLTAREAGRVLDAAGLQPPPVDAADLDQPVTGQSPVAGRSVPPESTVDLSLSSATAPMSLPWRAAAVVLAALAAASLVGRHLLRGRRDRRWVTEHVDVRPSAGGRHAEASTHRTSSERDLAVGLRGHRDDEGTQTLEEVHR